MILVGEIRDVETARIAVQSALTGHFVLSSLHATDAASALHRFLDMGIEPFLVASSVLGVVGAAPGAPDLPALPRAVRADADGARVLRAARRRRRQGRRSVHGAGCNFCAHTGYFDRVGVYEVLRGHRRDPGARSWPTPATTRSARRAPSRGHAHAAATRPCAWSTEDVNHHRRGRFAPSTSSRGAENAEVPLRRARPRRRQAVKAASTAENAASARFELAAAPARGAHAEGAQSFRQIELTKKQVKRAGDHATSPGSSPRSCEPGIPIIDALDAIGDGDARTLSSRPMLADDDGEAPRAATRSPTCLAATRRGLPRRTTPASCARPSSPATSTPCSTSSPTTSSATSRPAARSSRR